MKKFLKLFVFYFLISISLSSLPNFNETEPTEQFANGAFYPFLYEYDLTVTEYFYDEDGKETSEVTVYKQCFLKISNEEAMNIDIEMDKKGDDAQANTLYLIHSSYRDIGPNYWSIVHQNYGKIEEANLLFYDNWAKMPQIVKHILNCYGIENDEVFAIVYRPESGTTSIIFKYVEEEKQKEYHLNKLEELKNYLNTFDFYFNIEYYINNISPIRF